MHLPALSLPGAAQLLLDPAGQAVAAQAFGRRASWWNPGQAFAVAQLGYTPANKAGDNFSGFVGVGASNPSNGRLITISNTFPSAGRTGTYLLYDASFLADYLTGIPPDQNAWVITDLVAGAERMRCDGSGNWLIQTAGAGLRVKEGANAKMGAATLVAGTVVVNTTAVTANSRILLSGQNSSGTHGELTVSARTAGTSFTISSSNVADTRSIAWFILEPA